MSIIINGTLLIFFGHYLVYWQFMCCGDFGICSDVGCSIVVEPHFLFSCCLALAQISLSHSQVPLLGGQFLLLSFCCDLLCMRSPCNLSLK